MIVLVISGYTVGIIIALVWLGYTGIHQPESDDYAACLCWPIIVLMLLIDAGLWLCKWPVKLGMELRRRRR